MASPQFRLSRDNIHGNIENLGDFEDRINVPAHGCRHVMRGASFAPAVTEIPGPAGEAHAHVGIAEGEDGAFLVDALRCDELEMPVPVLRDAQMAKEAGVTEELKMTDQLRWVGMMNAIKSQVEEIIWNEIVYH